MIKEFVNTILVFSNERSWMVENCKPAWSHLPNAKHIDAVIASVKSHPTEWDKAGDLAWLERTSARDTAWDMAWDMARDMAWDMARAAARTAARDALAALVARLAAWEVVSALIAWDHSVKYLSMKPDELKIWYQLSEDPACLLLLPYAHAQELIAAKEGITA